MTSYPHWETLVARLEADLRSREPSASQSPGDDKAWKILGEILRSQGRVVVPHAGLQYSDIEDVVQGVLLKLQSSKAVRRLRAARSPEGYTFVMLRNAANDLARKRQVEKNLFRPIEDIGLAEETSSAPDYVQFTEESSVVRNALRLLSEEELNLIRMRFWKDMSIGEIAAETGVSYSAVAVKLFRIIHRLRDQME